MKPSEFENALKKSRPVIPSPLELKSYSKVFSEKECDEIISLLGGRQLQDGVVWNGTQYDVAKDQRNVDTAYVPKDDSTEWIYDRLDNLFRNAAEQSGFLITGQSEELKFLQYDKGSHFNTWHADVGRGYTARRKLSVSVELSSPSSYSGGILEIFPDMAIAKRNRGDAVVFPSFLYHRVSEVTDGTRFALVNWTSGPPFR